jgi:hypothetical protein
MKRIFKLYIACLLTVSLGVATVICCCIAPSVMAHFHKTVMCSHCQSENPNGNSSNPARTCRYQLTSAEFSNDQTISTPNASAPSFSASVFLNDHRSILSPILSLASPPGSPPLGIGFTPLYLRTFSLRI